MVTGGTSVVASLSEVIHVGGEVTYAWSHKATVAGGVVAWQAGGNVVLRNGATLDLAVSGGWGDSSPRMGVQVGTSIDLTRPRTIQR